MKKMLDFVNLVQKLVTTIAVISGGFWTYTLFIQHREAYVKANVSQSLACINVSDDARLLRLNVTIKNSGNKLLRLVYGEVQVKQVLPLTPDVIKEWEAIRGGKTESPEYFSWESIPTKPKPRKWRPGELDIEPGESENIYFDFFIPTKLKVVDVATWFSDEDKIKNKLGWGASTLIDLRKSEECQ